MPAPKGNDFAVGNSGGGAPEGNQNALGNDGGAPEGNANAMTHGRTMSAERRRETFTEGERAMHADLAREFRERGPEWSEKRAMQLADATVMETRLTVELLDAGFNRTERPPDGEEYAVFDVRKMDAHDAYCREIRELEDEAREDRRERKERERWQREAEHVSELLARDPDCVNALARVERWDDAQIQEFQGQYAPLSEPETDGERATDDPTTDIDREIAYESITPNPNETLAQTALADGSGEPPESADGELEDEPDVDNDESDFTLHRYTRSADMTR